MELFHTVDKDIMEEYISILTKGDLVLTMQLTVKRHFNNLRHPQEIIYGQKVRSMSSLA